ncbi:MAG: hypothetical protein LUE86_07770 [Clostridiales bacterium]|nr:hypothetical protein [Clostridiales bacterium]
MLSEIIRMAIFVICIVNSTIAMMSIICVLVEDKVHILCSENSLYFMDRMFGRFADVLGFFLKYVWWPMAGVFATLCFVAPMFI